MYRLWVCVDGTHECSVSEEHKRALVGIRRSLTLVLGTELSFLQEQFVLFIGDLSLSPLAIISQKLIII